MIVGSLILLGIGAIAGSYFILAGSLYLAALLALWLPVPIPVPDRISVKVDSASYWVGDEVTVRLSVSMKRGIGVLVVHSPLPRELELVSGNNLRVFWKGIKPVEEEWQFTFRAATRGEFDLPPTRWEAHHFAWVHSAVRGVTAESIHLAVRPPIRAISNMSFARGIAANRQIDNSLAVMGVSTTDFLEIRQYTPGDAVNTINWKASARRSSTGSDSMTQLYVNEYEREGRRAVWLFVDGSAQMRVGTVLSNPFEHAVEAATAISYFYLNKGYQVGAYLSSRSVPLMNAEMGQSQLLKLNRELTRLQSSTRPFDFREAVLASKFSLLRLQPQMFLITRIDGEPANSAEMPERLAHIVNGMRMLQGAAKSRRRARTNISLIVIPGYEFDQSHGASRNFSVALQRTEMRGVFRYLRALGMNVIEWNPLEERFGDVFVRQMIGSKV